MIYAKFVVVFKLTHDKIAQETITFRYVEEIQGGIFYYAKRNMVGGACCRC